MVGVLTSEDGDGNVAELWGTSAITRVGVLSGHDSTVGTVAFAPGGKTIASGDEGGSIKLWNVATRRELSTLARTGRPVNALRFSSDGQSLAG